MNDDLFARCQSALSGSYALERELGRGGAGVVFLATDLKHERQVAVKVLLPEIALAIGAKRFLQEISFAARLSHPHVLMLHDSGEADGLLFFVMPFVDGESVREWLHREGRLPLDVVVRIAQEVGGALDSAHRVGVVHRDVKPENILIQDGHAMVADFGIARAMDSSERMVATHTGMMVGTSAYMSPEQAGGAADLDGRSDLYGLACTVYEMLTGRPPFEARTLQEMLARHALDPVPSLVAARRDIPEHVEWAVVKAMAKRPGDRFATVSEFAAALSDPGAMGPLPPSASVGHDVGFWGRIRAAFSRAPTAPRITSWTFVGAIDSVAVMPFETGGGDQDAEYLADGITESIINKLSGLKGVRVVPRPLMFRFKGRGLDPVEVAREVQARAVVWGRTTLKGDALTVTAELMDVAKESQLWGRGFHRRLSDILSLQQEMATEIARSLRQELTGEEEQGLARLETENTAAYRAYLKGRHHWNKRTEEALRRSVEHLRQSLELDPAFVLAMAGLADSYTTLGIYGVSPPREIMPLARAAADDALAIDPRLSQALAPRGCVRALYDWDWEGSENDFLRAIENDPSHPTAHQWFAINCLAPQGRFDEARAALQQARALDPLSPAIGASVGLLHHLEGDDEAAVEEYLALLDLDPGFGLAHYFLGQAYVTQSGRDDAIASLEEAVDLTRHSPETVSALGHACATFGVPERARRLLAELEERAQERYVSPFLLAQIHVALGEPELALGRLEEAEAARASEMVWLAVRPGLRPLHGEPRYRDLCARVGLVAPGK